MVMLTDGRTAPPGHDGRSPRQSCRCRLHVDGCQMSSGSCRIPAGPLPLRRQRLLEPRSVKAAGPPIPVSEDMISRL